MRNLLKLILAVSLLFSSQVMAEDLSALGREAKGDPRVSQESDSVYMVDLSQMDGEYEENVAYFIRRIDEIAEGINNPQTEDEKRDSEGFTAVHAKNRILDNVGSLDIKKSYPVVGPQGLKIKYSFEDEERTMVLEIEKSSFARWKKHVEPKVYDFIGKLLY